MAEGNLILPTFASQQSGRFWPRYAHRETFSGWTRSRFWSPAAGYEARLQHRLTDSRQFDILPALVDRGTECNSIN
jgi:hypothetical protein